MWPFNRKQRFIQSLGKSSQYTPDLGVLETSMYRLLFVVDDMKKAHKNYKLLEGHGKRVSRGFTRETFDFRVGKHTGKALPFFAKDGLRVKGELHAVESSHIPVLDKHYQNGVEFVRVPADVLVTGKEHELMSIGNEKFIQNLLPGMIRTVPELGIRHYTSNNRVCVIHAMMYIALRAHWNMPDVNTTFLNPRPEFPQEPLIWLPKYYRYPIERNRCLK